MTTTNTMARPDTPLGGTASDHAHREDLSRLRPLPEWRNMAHVYEPLDDLVTDEDLSPYCCYADRVHFYRWYARSHDRRVAESGHSWRAGDRVEAFGEPHELLSARCVYRRGQWCMRWLARGVAAFAVDPS